MTPLESIIHTEISAKGAMRIDRYMELCLSHPEHGYYMTRDPLGVDGDFTTAPEISQMFGELVGLWLAQKWLDLGSPAAFNLVELGPGRGTLMADILRVGATVPGFLDAAQILMIESSPVLRQTQKTSLAGHNCSWIGSIAELPAKPSLFVANEFFDALPIRQFQNLGDVWLERVVKLDGGKLAFGHVKTNQAGFPLGLPDGAIVEISEVRRGFAKAIAGKIKSDDGAALIFDYGDVSGSGDTLQAVAVHACTDVLSKPGDADLTAHVNFGELAGAVADCAAHATTQGQFLAAMGIADRASRLKEGKSAKDAEIIDAALRRLTDPSEMGTLFKAMSVTRADAPKPPGF